MTRDGVGQGGRATGGPGSAFSRELIPREHGAYAQLAFPLLTGLAYARFHPGAIAFAAAAVALFLAHEPVALITGARGKRLQDALHDAARRRLVVLIGAAALALGAAIVLAPLRAWIAGAVPAALALALLPLFGRRGIKSLAAELVVAAAFAASLLPLALASAVPVAVAVMAALVWFGAAAPAILAVHAVKARHRRKPERTWTLRATPIVAALTGSAGIAAALLLPPWGRLGFAVLPPAVASLATGLLLPHPRNLKRIGWAMVVADTLALVLLLGLA